MKIDFWHQRWLRNEIGFHQGHFNTHLEQFWNRLELTEGRRVFVPLCGKSLDLLWLRAEGYQVTGVEISAVAVRDFFEENDLVANVTRQGEFDCWEADGLTILCGDFFALKAEDLRDCSGIFDRASLIALPTEMRKEYVAHLSRIAPAKTRTLLVTMEYPQHQMQGPPFSVEEQEVRELFAGYASVDRLLILEILQENPRFQRKGLTRLHEKVYLLDPV
ncbi:MAG: thiopurine S-methyltransferase [Gammaproteobacteria bacterium]|nr:thiopurine S-methyltransferase [Gammaproteobacteria bacterium]